METWLRVIYIYTKKKELEGLAFAERDIEEGIL